jgi:hypothetical protein
LTAVCVRFFAWMPKTKARSDGHTSTKYFVVWKTSAGIFPRKNIQNPREEFVKWRDGNCRRDGARRGSAGSLKMARLAKTHDWHVARKAWPLLCGGRHTRIFSYVLSSFAGKWGWGCRALRRQGRRTRASPHESWPHERRRTAHISPGAGLEVMARVIYTYGLP